MELCKLCKSKEATKTNSHLLPAFVEAIVGSYDHSYKRDRDILFTKTAYETKVHVGAIPSDENDRLFDQDELSDDRIKNELAINPCAMDNIFCPECESALSTQLETPYSKYLRCSHNISGRLAYFFWISIIWRMSIGKSFGYMLPEDIESILGGNLYDYFKISKDDTCGINNLIKRTPFCYKLFHCCDYCKNHDNGGLIHCWLSDSKKSIMCILGDYGIEACFSREFQSEAPEYFLNRSIIESGPVNNGLKEEQIQPIEMSLWSETHKSFIHMTKKKILNGHIIFLQHLWQMLKDDGYIVSEGGMPPKMAYWIIERMYSDEGVKFGDKFTNKRWRDIIIEALAFPQKWNHL